MRSTTGQYLRTGAVLFGALVVVGLPTFVAVVVATTRLADLLGLSVAPRTASGVPWLLGVGAGLALASEATAVRLHGNEALWRGSQRDRAVRYGTLVAVSLAALVTVGSFLAGATRWAVANERPGYLVLLGAVGLAVAWVAARAARAFRRGQRESRGGRA